jgi:hypothetical protein
MSAAGPDDSASEVVLTENSSGRIITSETRLAHSRTGVVCQCLFSSCNAILFLLLLSWWEMTSPR